MTAFSIADASGQLVASVILKKARNEVHIRVFPGENGHFSDDLVQRFDLDALSSISSVAWFNDVAKSQKKKGKKRAPEANGSAAKGESEGPAGLLAVVLENSEILVLSPFSASPTQRITELKEVLRVAGSRNPNAFWALTPGALIEYSISTQSISTLIKLQKANYNCIQHITIGSKDTVALGSSHVQFADPAKKQLSGKIQTEGPVVSLQQLGSYLYVALENSNSVDVYDLSKGNENLGRFECAGEVNSIHTLSQTEIAVFTSKGAEIFEGLELKSTLKGPVKALFAQKQAYVAVLYDRNQPEFEIITDLKLTITLHAKSHKKKKSKKEPTPDALLSNSKPVQINNLPPLELFSSLSALITAKRVLHSKVIRLCASNDDEDNIKETITLFTHSDDRELLVKHLFTIVSLKVAADPLTKNSLSIWLKWILLTHGGYILKQDLLRENLRKLQRSLEGGMSTMSRLLALQGRLQLLKSHAEFRSQIAQAEEQQAELDSEDEEEEENETTLANQSANVEELIVYANGENDDFDSVENLDETFEGGDESEDEFVSFEDDS